MLGATRGGKRRKINRRAAHTLYSDAVSGTVTTAVAGWDGPRIYGIPQITHRHTLTDTHTHTHTLLRPADQDLRSAWMD